MSYSVLLQTKKKRAESIQNHGRDTVSRALSESAIQDWEKHGQMRYIHSFIPTPPRKSLGSALVNLLISVLCTLFSLSLLDRPLTADWQQVCLGTRPDTVVKSVFQILIRAPLSKSKQLRKKTCVTAYWIWAALKVTAVMLIKQQKRQCVTRHIAPLLETVALLNIFLHA